MRYNFSNNLDSQLNFSTDSYLAISSFIALLSYFRKMSSWCYCIVIIELLICSLLRFIWQLRIIIHRREYLQPWMRWLIVWLAVFQLLSPYFHHVAEKKVFGCSRVRCTSLTTSTSYCLNVSPGFWNLFFNKPWCIWCPFRSSNGSTYSRKDSWFDSKNVCTMSNVSIWNAKMTTMAFSASPQALAVASNYLRYVEFYFKFT